jgi:pre-mRNA-splicing factor RBM22/SLT11
MATVKRDQVKHAWEETEFPLVCETCLGDNPYVRMTKQPHGKKCQVCENPFTVFAWQAGTKGRLKRVEICRSCAQAKNVCQVCIYDLQYGLPVKVRDKVLREAGASGATSAVPQSMANRAWYTAQQQRALEQGQDLVGTSAVAHAKLSEMARMEPRYERNLAKLCSFFARGECNRGSDCPFRHEMPKDRNDPMSAQSTKNRFYGSNDPVANKILGRKRRIEDEQQKEAGDYEKARATLYVRLRGDEPFPALTEEALRDLYYAFGEIVSIKAQAAKGQAFIEFTTPEATDLAIASTNNREMMGRQLYAAWARAPKRGEASSTSGGTAGIKDPTAGLATASRAAAAKPGVVAAPGVQSRSPVRLVAPPGTNTKLNLPKGLKVKPPAAVAALAAKRRAAGAGGGPVRRVGGSVAPAAPYPSANPNRLGTKGDPAS